MISSLYTLIALALGRVHSSGAAVISCKCVGISRQYMLDHSNISLTPSRAPTTHAGHRLLNGEH